MSITTIKKLTSTPFIVDIPTSQWNGENGNFYITVNASNITANSILVPSYDYNSADLFAGTKLWCEPANGSFTINVDVKPAGTVTVLVQFMGVVGEANYQVLSDVYSKSQTYSKSEVYTKSETNSAISQSTANFIFKGEIDNLNTPVTYTAGNVYVNTFAYNATNNPWPNAGILITQVGRSFAFQYAFVYGAIAGIRSFTSNTSTFSAWDTVAQKTEYQKSEDITLSGITASLKQIKRSGNTVVFSLRGTVDTEIPGYTNGRIIVPEAFRPREAINVCVPYKIGSTVNVEQCQVMSDGNVRFGTTVPTGLLVVTFTYVV